MRTRMKHKYITPHGFGTFNLFPQKLHRQLIGFRLYGITEINNIRCVYHKFR